MKTNCIVRQINPTEYTTAYELIQTAFLTAEHHDGDEQDFAANLRKGPNYLPGLELVAEADGQLVGHIMLTKTKVLLSNGGTYDTLMVAPLSVLEEYRSSGIGSLLMNEALRRAAEMGYGAAFLLGDPNYYQRFGFRPTQLFGIGHDLYPAEYLLGAEIVPGTLKGITGKIDM